MDMNYKGTVIHIGAAPAEEQIYCYSTSDEAQEKACIGHLRGDFGADDEGFFTSWFPHSGKIMADDAHKVFCTELDHVVYAVIETAYCSLSEPEKRNFWERILHNTDGDAM